MNNKQKTDKLHRYLLSAEIDNYCSQNESFFNGSVHKNNSVEWSEVQEILHWLAIVPIDTPKELLFEVCFKLGLLEFDEIHKVACRIFPSQMRFTYRKRQ